MTYYARDVERFQEKFGLPTPPVFRFLPQDLHDFRVTFFNEELVEYIEAHRDGDLATAIDSLIDMVYITCGAALLHGMKSQNFHVLAETICVPDKIFSDVDGPHVEVVHEDEELNKPHLLDTELHAKLCTTLEEHISDYEEAVLNKSRAGVEKALANLYMSCMLAATSMGISERCWDELWDDVQRANMAKERAPSKDKSKRNSEWDVIKPAGWQPPQTEEILKKYL